MINPRIRITAAFLVLLVFACARAAPSGGGPLDGLARVRDARSGRRTSNATTNPSNRDNVWIPAGETRTIADLSGPGMIRHIWLTFAEAGPGWLSKDGAAAPDEIVLRMYWDGAPTPAVEAPLGDFFGSGFGRRVEVNSAVTQVQGGDAYNCFWPMPFLTSAKITVTNESNKPFAAFYYNIDYTQEPVPEDFAYFCAKYRNEFPTKLGGDYLIANIEGAGHYVGTVLSVRTRSPEWFGEGDEKIYIDGDEKPTIQGTGTEDYFLNAWGLEKNCFPYFGVTLLDGEWGHVGARFCAYRWHINDPIYFKKSAKVMIEHYGWMSADETKSGKIEGFVEREDDFATVAFWYQKDQPVEFTKMPPLSSRRWPNLDIIYEGKDLINGSTAADGTLTLQKGTEWTGDGQLFFSNESAGAHFEVHFNVTKEEYRRLIVPMTLSYDFGIYQMTLDGKPVGESVDYYNATVEVSERSLGDHKLSVGPHTLGFICKGKNAASKGYKIGVDSVRMRERFGPKR